MASAGWSGLRADTIAAKNVQVSAVRVPSTTSTGERRVGVGARPPRVRYRRPVQPAAPCMTASSVTQEVLDVSSFRDCSAARL
jgi:hypothetical protein